MAARMTALASAGICAGRLGAGNDGQSVPKGVPYGVATHDTEGSAAIFSRAGVTAAITAGSVTVPDSGDHTTRAVVEVASPAPLTLVSISVALSDSVSGREKESLSVPPKRVPSTPTMTLRMTQAPSASHGRLTAQRDSAPTSDTP